jgi:hypothetical protein
MGKSMATSIRDVTCKDTKLIRRLWTKIQILVMHVYFKMWQITPEFVYQLRLNFIQVLFIFSRFRV